MQWFYFSVKNTKKIKVKFNIFRFRKCYSLFQRGFRPYVKSKRQGGDWTPAGEKVKYFRELSFNENGVKKPTQFYYLSFYYTFQHENDQIYMAACIPYTVSYLQERLTELQLSFSSEVIRYETSSLCKTLCGQDVDLLTMQPRNSNQNLLPKQFIIINTRSHPGETAASWVADGLIENLLQNQNIHEWMVKGNICFKIVPMLNKDGVFMGNYRTGIVGDDYNRRFNSGQRDFFPEISALKKLVSKCKKIGKVKLFLDLHGHSILKNSFIFGPDKRSYEEESLIRIGDTLVEISKYFSTVSSHYRNQKGKIETARVYFQLQEDILSLTCENSLGLYTDHFQTFQQKILDWKDFGKHLLEAIRQNLCQDGHIKNPSQNKIKFNIKTPSFIPLGVQKKGRQGFSREKIANNEILKRKKSTNIGQKKEIVPLLDEKQENSSKKIEENRDKKGSPVSEIPWKVSKDKKKIEKEKRFKEDSQQEHNLQRSIILTRYGQSKSEYKDNSPQARLSKTAVNRESISLNRSQKERQEQSLLGEEISLPDNFSEDYESMNDSDTDQDDIDMSKKQQLFECIKQMNIKDNYQEEEFESTNPLIPLKGFKQYKFTYEQEQIPAVDRRPLSKLKPLKYQQFKQRGFTQKKIKRNMDILFSNHSYVTSDREKARLLLNKNEMLSKRNKGSKKDQMMAEIFPHLEEHEYLLMRIREMKLQNQRESDK